MLEIRKCSHVCRSPWRAQSPSLLSEMLAGGGGWSPHGKSWSWVSYCCSVLRHVRLFATPWTAARQASLSFTISQSLLKLMSIELVMPSNHLTVWCPLLLLPSIFPSIRVFSNELALCIRWPKYWSFSISPSNEHRKVHIVKAMVFPVVMYGYESWAS